MPHVVFTQNLQRHINCPPRDVEGSTVREVLDVLFQENPRARSYVLDDQDALRKHVIIFINGEQVKDRVHLSDPVVPTSEIYVMQALSGG